MERQGLSTTGDTKSIDPSPRRGRPPLSDGDLNRRRERIIAVATRMFIEKGFPGTYLEAVAAGARVRKKTIYDLIGDKEALFRAACHSMRAEGPTLKIRVPPHEENVRVILASVARQLIEHSVDGRLLALMRAVIAEAGMSRSDLGKALAGSKEHLFSTLSEILTGMIDRGSLPSVDAYRAAELFYDAMVGAAGLRAAMGIPDPKPSDEDIAERVEMFLIGHVRLAGDAGGT